MKSKNIIIGRECICHDVIIEHVATILNALNGEVK